MLVAVDERRELLKSLLKGFGQQNQQAQVAVFAPMHEHKCKSSRETGSVSQCSVNYRRKLIRTAIIKCCGCAFPSHRNGAVACRLASSTLRGTPPEPTDCTTTGLPFCYIFAKQQCDFACESLSVIQEPRPATASALRIAASGMG